MTPFAWLLGLVLPACAGVGAEGVPRPPPLDLVHLERPASPNTALAAPEGTGAHPDIVTPVYPLPASRLWSAIRDVAAGQPRTYSLAMDEARMEASWVARSAVLNFPDVIIAQVTALPGEAGREAGSTLALYSRSLYGRSDFGVNRQRLEAWLAALDASLRSKR